MTEKSLVRSWHGQGATFLDAHDGIVVVTVANERKEMSEAEWDQLASHVGETPQEFNRPGAADSIAKA